MNILFWIILIAIIVEFIIDIILTILNIRSINTNPPNGLEDVYDFSEYKKSQEYTLTRSKFSLIVTIVQILAMLIFWFSGGFNFVDQMIRVMEWNEIANGILFIFILSGLSMALNLPFDLYETFVIEEKFGFNKTTISTYFIDTLKSLILSMIIGAPLIGCVIFFFEQSGVFAWLYAWIFIIIISLIIQVIAPVWIMPIFNKFTPLEESELRSLIIDYTKSVNFTFGNIFVIDGSKRSNHSNAFFTGFGKTKRIALFDTLIDQLSEKEIVSVIAHEVGHSKKKHIITSTILSIINTGVMFFLLSLFIENSLLSEAFYMKEVSIYASIIFFGLLFTPINLILPPLIQFISRKNEYQADKWSIETTNDKKNLISGLKKLAAKNLSNLSPHPLIVFLQYSHPPILDRIKAINLLQEKQ
jgi:STE24 endopeptidase